MLSESVAGRAGEEAWRLRKKERGSYQRLRRSGTRHDKRQAAAVMRRVGALAQSQRSVIRFGEGAASGRPGW